MAVRAEFGRPGKAVMSIGRVTVPKHPSASVQLF